MIMVLDVLLSLIKEVKMKNKSFYFTLLLFFIAMDTSAARCRNVSIKYNFPAQIDITNKKVGDKLYSFGAPDARLDQDQYK